MQGLIPCVSPLATCPPLCLIVWKIDMWLCIVLDWVRGWVAVLRAWVFSFLLFPRTPRTY